MATEIASRLARRQRGGGQASEERQTGRDQL